MDRAFVSMPFADLDNEEAEWSRLYRYCLAPLEKPVASNREFQPIRLIRADKNLKSLALKDNVKSLIGQSRIVIAVLTKQDLGDDLGRAFNPNVLWEIGYAEALGKPLVVLADDETVHKLPALAGEVRVCQYDHEMVRRCKPRHAAESLAPIVADISAFVRLACEQAKGGGKNAQRGTVVSWPDRSHVDLPTLIAQAQKNVEILTTNLNFLTSKEFLRPPQVTQPLESAIRTRASVKIVTMDPESIIAEYRARQLGREGNLPGYRQELRDGIIYLYQRYGSHDNFQLRLYNDLPLQITYHIDSTVITSVVTKGDRARKRIQIQFDEWDHGVGRSFLEHFTSTFESATNASSVAWVINGQLSAGFSERLRSLETEAEIEDREILKQGRPRGRYNEELPPPAGEESDPGGENRS